MQGVTLVLIVIGYLSALTTVTTSETETVAGDTRLDCPFWEGVVDPAADEAIFSLCQIIESNDPLPNTCDSESCASDSGVGDSD